MRIENARRIVNHTNTKSDIDPDFILGSEVWNEVRVGGPASGITFRIIQTEAEMISRLSLMWHKRIEQAQARAEAKKKEQDAINIRVKERHALEAEVKALREKLAELEARQPDNLFKDRVYQD